VSGDETPRADLAAAAAAIPRRLPRPLERERQSVIDGDEDAVAAAALLDGRRDEWQATVPRRFWSARCADFPTALRTPLETWARDDDRGNLVLFGAVGVGKTHAALAACRAPFGAGAMLQFLPVGELLDQLDWRRPDSARTLEQLCQVDLLIVDDLGAERSNEWTGERLYLVINRRWLDGRPTIVTTNLSLGGDGELCTAVGERTYSRLAHGAESFELTGKDHRRV
jgi:DNA replication protein DnaC